MAKIGVKELADARQTYQKYAAGKKNLEDRIRDNETWFRMQHWKNLRDEQHQRKQTGWLHAAIVNKHADFMDNAPEANVLAREPSDEQTATMLTSILPVVMDRAGWKRAYNDCCYDKLKFGGGIYFVPWDPNAMNGLGDVKVLKTDPLNLYWEPGIENLQESKNVFLTELIDVDDLCDAYKNIKDLKDKITGNAADQPRYVFDENIDTTGKARVYNWYYKKEGLLHYCRFVEDVVLFATENEKGYENGWYNDGKYPFVIDPMFREPWTPYGFGIIDTMRDTQEDIDQLNELTMANAKIAARRRFFVRNDANINEDEYADLEKDFVHYAGNLNEYSIREIASEPYSGTYVAIMENKINELKENAFNRDVNTGGSGQTSTAAGIAALQEAGSKSSRDAIQNTYRAFQEIVEMVIERIRQFYTVPRVFRIVGEDKQTEYMEFSNEGLTGRPVQGIYESFGTKEPVFDLDIRVSKTNAWSRQAQNQDVLNFYGLGFFNPQQATMSLACLEVLEIENKDKLIEIIKRNGTQQQFMEQFLPVLIQAAAMSDPQLAMAAQKQAIAAGILQQPAVQQAAPQQMANTDVNGQVQQANAYMDKQRAIAAGRTTPQV